MIYINPGHHLVAIKGFRKSSWRWRTPGGLIVVRWYLSWALRQALYMLLGPPCPQYPLLMSDIISGLQHYFLLSSESFSWLLKNCLWLMGIDPGGTVFSLSPDLQTNYPSHAFGGPLQSCLCSLSVSSSPVTNRFWKKLPLVALNLRLYESQQQEEKSKPISHYPVPYEKDLPFDVWELLEEIEKERCSPRAESHSQRRPLLAGG